MHALWDFLKANWPYEAVGLWLLGEALAKIPKVRANSAFELVFNFVEPIVRKVPLVGQLAGLLDTPAPAQPKPVAEQGK